MRVSDVSTPGIILAFFLLPSKFVFSEALIEILVKIIRNYVLKPDLFHFNSLEIFAISVQIFEL